MAQLEIKFVNVERSPALEKYAQDHIQHLMRRLDRSAGDYKFIDILFRSESKDTEGVLKSAEVLITYRYPGIPTVFHVKKHGVDLRTVLEDAIDALENKVQRAIDKNVRRRRKNPKPNQNFPIDDLDVTKSA